MKLAFSTRHVIPTSFVDLCNTANEYGYAGIELTERDMDGRKYPDGPFGNDRVGAKRKLVNRHLAISAICCETPVGATEEDGTRVTSYVKAAAKVGAQNVVLTIVDGTDPVAFYDAMRDAIYEAEKSDVTLLFETVGYYSNTQNLLDLLHHFATTQDG